MEKWRYYNHAMIPRTAPHEKVDLTVFDDKGFWKNSGFSLFARWHSDFDCNEKTEWWFVIKDSSFDITSLKSKRRYEINKGMKNFDVHIIDSKKYVDDIYQIELEAWKEYPPKYRPIVDEKIEKGRIEKFNDGLCFGAFSLENNQLCGFAYLEDNESYADFVNLKVLPCCEKKAINAAIVYSIIMHFNERLEGDFYICDGARALFHETAFQDYLEKYFGFRKAYCHLNMKYRFLFGILVKLLFPFRRMIKGKGKISSRIKTILKFEEFARISR